MTSRILLCVLAGAFFAFLPGQARADQAADLLAKHRAFVGYSFGDGTVSSLRIEGHTVHHDKGQTLEVDRFVKLRHGPLFRTTTTEVQTGLTESAGFSGSAFWASNENGFTHLDVGDELKSAIAFELFSGDAAATMAATDRGTKTIDGVSYPVVQVKLQMSDPLDLYIDPATGAYKYFTVDPDGPRSATYDVLSYQDVKGKKFVSQFRRHGSSYLTEYTKFELNAQVSDDDLRAPQQTATWSFGNGTPFPVELSKDGFRLRITAVVNGVPGHFVLDTGASGIVLDNAFARKITLENIASGEAYGIGGVTRTQVQRAKTIAFGDNILSNVIVSTGNAYTDKESPDGLIGYDLFGGAIAKLNIDANKMTLLPPTASLDDAKGIRVFADLSNGVPTVPVKLDGLEVNAQLDTGDPAFILMAHDFVSKHGLRMIREEGYLGGVGGVERVECGHLNSLTIGSVLYQNPNVCTSFSFEGNDALVGLDLLKHFNITFDYPHSSLYLEPRKE